MRGRWVLVPGLALLLTGGGIAGADHNGHEFETSQECIGSGLGFDHQPSCTRYGSGPWVARYGPVGANGSGAFGVFVVFALLLAAAPAVACGFIASNRGQSVGLAVLLGIALSWIGLLIVVFAFKPEVAAAARNVIDNASRPTAPPAPARDTASRIMELDRLKREKLITEHEYATRRAAILEDI